MGATICGMTWKTVKSDKIGVKLPLRWRDLRLLEPRPQSNFKKIAKRCAGDEVEVTKVFYSVALL